MDNEILGIYFSSWRKEYGKSPVELYRKVVRIKANPRDDSYMRSAFYEKFPSGKFVNVNTNINWTDTIPAADMIVLLYPDSIGIGFSCVESEVLRKKKMSTKVVVLNGRRRLFEFNSSTRHAMRVRRFIETLMLGEILASIIFVLFTPVLLLIDFLRGKR